MTGEVKADLTPFTADLAELAARLKALDPAEGLAGDIRRDVEDCFSLGSDQLVDFALSTTTDAGEILIKLQLGAALRAMQGDNFIRHGGLRG